MSSVKRWQLPDGVEELLPTTARRLESLRRRVTDLHFSFGYELVNPPLIEYLESLLTGTGETLDLQTFKLVDQLNGRTMGVRADMTPQVARIDAHLLQSQDVSRLFYMGSVLRTRPDSPGGSRSPLQLGAELYGHGGPESDIEIITLMLKTLETAGITRPLLDIGHVGVYRGLVSEAALVPEQEQRLFDAILRKSAPEVTDLLGEFALPAAVNNRLSALLELSGGTEVIDAARSALAGAPEQVARALDTLQIIVSTLQQQGLSSDVHVDLTELRGYAYHTGVLFAAFAESSGDEVARGGRYDDIGAAFGRARPATGYSTDLKMLARGYTVDSASPRGIFVGSQETDASAEVARLREQGERVVTQLPGSSQSGAEAVCDRELIWRDNQWVIVDLTT